MTVMHHENKTPKNDSHAPRYVRTKQAVLSLEFQKRTTHLLPDVDHAESICILHFRKMNTRRLFPRSSFVRSFVRSFIHSFLHSFVRSFIYSSIHSFIHSFILNVYLCSAPSLRRSQQFCKYKQN